MGNPSIVTSVRIERFVLRIAMVFLHFPDAHQAKQQPQILRLTTPKLKYAWGPVRSG